MNTHTPDFPPLDDLNRLAHARHDDPFAVLGPHDRVGSHTITVFRPDAASITVLTGGQETALPAHSKVAGVFSGAAPKGAYRLRATAHQGAAWDFDDPYAFGPTIGEMDEYLLAEGTHQHIWRVLGAHGMDRDGVRGVQFAVWAPNATRASVVGPFNQWDGRLHPMRRRAAGVWELFIPGLGDGETYKYELCARDGTVLPLKADPVGFGSQHPPENASVVRDIDGYGWDDTNWMTERAGHNARTAPISIYEVHLGSWKRVAAEGNRALSYKEAARDLVTYVADMGFTHIELMPISEYPFDGSWGYQPVGLFAPTIRHGPPHEFRDLIDAAHQVGLGVLIDWVPGHFPTDAHGLGQFDGTALYEHADPREGFHQDWNTLIYNYGRTEVANFLISNALYWLEEYHIDGLRVDAVASMLYRDYSRKQGEWVPNIHGGRENLEAIAMLQRMNTVTYGEAPGIMTVAEESTSFPNVSRPVDGGGLGFGYKWNMGWMNDTLSYMQTDPIYRKHDHHKMTFGMHYAYSENFILPISHDEVVHGKGSMLNKMPGTPWEKFANLRAYYAFMWGHPGKKLLFMGQEFAQPEEWNHDAELNWALTEQPDHAGMQRLVRDLNTLYRAHPALHMADCDPHGFEWIEANDEDASVFAWIRRGDEGVKPVVVVCNFTPVERGAYQVGLPQAGRWREALNSDAKLYGGEDRGNMGAVTATKAAHQGQPASAKVVIPPLSAIFLIPED